MPPALKINPQVLKTPAHGRKIPSVKIHHVTARGLKTAWLEAGSPRNDILLLLHGFPDDAHVWDAQIDRFKKRYHVIAPFARGTGPSEPTRDESRYGPDAALLDHLEILRHADPSGKRGVFLVGHDLGTLHAWRLAPLLGGRIKGLVIINGAHPLQIWSRRTNPRQIFKSWYTYVFMVPAVAETILRIFGRPIFKRAYASQGMPEECDPGAKRAASRAPFTVKQYRETAKAFGEDYFGDRFRLKAPVLAISSTQDAYLEPATIEELECLAEHPTVRVIEGRHWIQCEQPERVNALLEKFFKPN